MKSSQQGSPNSAASKSHTLWGIGMLVAVIGILALIGVRLFTDKEVPLALGELPEDFTLTTFAGQTIHSNELQGKVVLVNFWASWCTTCDDEARMLKEAWVHYQEQEGNAVAFLGVAYMDTEPAALEFISNYGITYPNGPDLRGEISKIFQVKNVPETFILDRDGRLYAIKIGPFLAVDEIYTIIDTALTKD